MVLNTITEMKSMYLSNKENKMELISQEYLVPLTNVNEHMDRISGPPLDKKEENKMTFFTISDLNPDLKEHESKLKVYCPQ